MVLTGLDVWSGRCWTGLAWADRFGPVLVWKYPALLDFSVWIRSSDRSGPKPDQFNFLFFLFFLNFYPKICIEQLSINTQIPYVLMSSLSLLIINAGIIDFLIILSINKWMDSTYIESHVHCLPILIWAYAFLYCHKYIHIILLYLFIYWLWETFDLMNYKYKIVGWYKIRWDMFCSVSTNSTLSHWMTQTDMLSLLYLLLLLHNYWSN